MSPYIWIIVWLGIAGIFLSIAKSKQGTIYGGNTEFEFRWWIAFLLFFPIIWMAGTRGPVADTYAYMGGYMAMPDSLSGIPEYLGALKKDQGFYLFSALIKALIGNNVTLYLFILSFIQGLSLISIFRKYSRDYFLSVFLFVVSTDYFSWMFNGIRQFTAVTIIFAATSLMINKKYLRLILIILFASTMHQSALLMLPMVFIAQGKAWNKKTLMIIFLAIIAVVFVGEFTDLLNDALAETQYENVVSDWESWEDDGTSILRVLVYAVPTFFAFIGRNIIKQTENKLIHFCTNMSIMSTGLYVVSMFTSGIFIGRLPIYASLYGYILLPWEIENIFTTNSKKLVYFLMILLYLLFYYYQFHFGWGLI